MYPSGGFSLNFVNCVKPVQGSDRFRSPTTFHSSSIRPSCNTSKVVSVLLITSMYRGGVGNDSSFGTEFNSWFNVMTTKVIHFDRPKSMVENRPTLLEKRRCVPCLVQNSPEWKWIFGKSSSFPDILAVPSAFGEHDVSTISRPNFSSSSMSATMSLSRYLPQCIS